MKKVIITVTILLLLMLCAFPIVSHAEDIAIDLENITDGTTGEGYSYSGGMLTISGNGPFMITANGNTVTDRIIVIAANVTANVTLNDLKIDVSSIKKCALAIPGGSTLNLTLAGENVLTSGDNRAGLEVPSGAKLTVTTQSTGKLTVTGGTSGAGIGGGYQADCGTVTILGGDITAVGMHTDGSEYEGGGAGIGGGGCGNIVSGYGGNGGIVVIDGGMVQATGGACAAGIGGGSAWSSGGNAGNITIKSGTVTATGPMGAAGIGGGWQGGGGSINISGGNVTANGSGPEHPLFGECGGAGIGGGSRTADAGNIVITGGTVVANGGGNAAGIGHGYYFSGTASGSVHIEDGDITATGGIAGAGIGSGLYGKNISVTINGGTVNATGSKGGAGIGSGLHGSDVEITITGGDITATGHGGEHPTMGEAFGAGIGAGMGNSTTVITGGTVTATGGEYGGAGIGGKGGTIEITGGTVTAAGGHYDPGYTDRCGGAGIGGTAHDGFYGIVTISGGTIYAARGEDAQNDIGYGKSGSGMTLNISGSAAVLLQNDSCIAPVTAIHTHETFSSGTTEAYGIAVPSAWGSGFGAYLRLVTLSYDLNNGTGTVPLAVTRNYLTAVTASNGIGITRASYQLSGWNTAADGSGTACALGGAYTVTQDTTLYAQWTAKPALTSSDEDGIINTGGRIVMTPNIGGGTWDWDKTFFSAALDSAATFTALKAGTSAITYTVEGQTISYTIIVNKAIPTYIIPTGLTAAYGDTLADVALPSGFTWESAGKTSVGDIGNNSFTVMYSPLDMANYETVKGISVTIAVTKAVPEYSVPAGLTAEYGDTLADVSLPAGFTWEHAETTSVGKAGKHSFTATYTPSDTEHYKVVTGISVTITVRKQAAVTLSGLTVNSGELSPAFSRSTYRYTVSVDNNVDSITVTPYITDNDSTITVNDEEVENGEASEGIVLSVGPNTIAVVVTNRDDVKKTYTIVVTRAKSSSEESAYVAMTLTDKDTGVIVTGTMSPDAVLKVTDIDLSSIEDASGIAILVYMKDGNSVMLFYKNISITGGFSGALTVTLPVDARYNGQILTILHGVNGTVETLTATVTDGMITFTVYSLSPFAVITDAGNTDNSAEITDGQEDLQASADNTNNGNVSYIWCILGGAVIVGVVLIAILIIRKYRRMMD